MKWYKLLIVAVFVVVQHGAAFAWYPHGASVPGIPFDPLAPISSSVLADFDAAQGVTTSAGLVTTWVAKTGGITATRASTGPSWSATARNGLPGVVFTGNAAERMTFPVTGFPIGNAEGSMIVVGYNASNGVAATAAGYGSGTVTADSRRIDVGTTNLLNPSTYGPGAASTVGSPAWSSTDMIGYAKFGGALQTVSSAVNGEKFSEIYLSLVTNASSGRIGSNLGNAGPWNGVIQRVIFFNRALTPLELAQITGYLAWVYNLTGLLADAFPYKAAPPVTTDTADYDPFTTLGMASIYRDDFTALSLRTGGYESGSNTGYNSASAKGVWAVNGDEYMIFSTNYSDFGWGVWLNSNYNWQASIDPSFPPLGMEDITTDGVVLTNSEDHPLVRATLGNIYGTAKPYLSSYLASTHAAKVAMPYAREYVYTLNQAGIADFPAVWSLSDISIGKLNAQISVAGNQMTVISVGSGPPGLTTIKKSLQIGSGGAIYQIVTDFGTGTGGTGTYTLQGSIPTNFTASISGTVMNVTAIDPNQKFRVGQVISGSGVTAATIVSYGTGAGFAGTYNISVSQTVASTTMSTTVPSYSTTLAYSHYEIDDFEFFGTDYPLSWTSQGTFIPMGLYQVGGKYNTGFTTYPGIQHTTRVIYTVDWVYLYFDGVLRERLWNKYGTWDIDDPHHMILNNSSGMSWKTYPGAFTGTVSGNVLTISTIGEQTNIPVGGTVSGTGVAVGSTIMAYGSGGTTGTGRFGTYQLSDATGSVPTAVNLLVTGVIKNDSMTVRRAELFAPPSNTSFTVPSVAYPVPVVAWSGNFSGRTIPLNTANGTTVATLSGASLYQLLDYNGAVPSHLAISGSNLVTSGTLVAGAYDFYIRGCASDGSTCTGALTDGTPGIAPKIRVTIGTIGTGSALLVNAVDPANLINNTDPACLAGGC